MTESNNDVAVAAEPLPPQEDERKTVDVESPFRLEQDLSQILDQKDPNRMKLTEEENRHALDIRSMVEAAPDLDDISDFMCAQLAIVCKDDVENALRRCYAMQDFRQEYAIVDSYEQGSRYLEWMFTVFPKWLLSLSFSKKEGTYMFVQDMEKFDSRALTTAVMADDWMKAMYYGHFLFHPDIESIRKGIVGVCECTGLSMNRGTMNHFCRFFSEFLAYYPFYGQCRFVNSGAMVNIIASALRKILPSDLRPFFQIGFQLDQHLGDVFLVPTVEEANKRMLLRMQDALRMRYERERTFKLIE